MTDAFASAPRPYLDPAPMGGMVRVSAPPGLDLIDLSLNESSWGPAPGVVAAAQARVAAAHRYPDPASAALRAALGATYGLPVDGIVCGNGSEELIDAIVRAFARTGDEVLYPANSFAQFRLCAIKSGATPVPVPTRDHHADVDAMLAALTPRTKVVFLANPDNPTGTWIPRLDVERLVAGVPSSVILVLDAAYGEYCLDSDYSYGHDLVADRPNIIVTRTFSKAWGLAAFRVGWLHTQPAVAGALNRFRGVGNVNAVAQAAALAALDDPRFVQKVARETAAERDRVTAALTGLGCTVAPSACNFVLARLPDGVDRDRVQRTLLAAHGIAVNALGIYDLAGHLRIGIGVPAENDRLIGALEAVILSP